MIVDPFDHTSPSFAALLRRTAPEAVPTVLRGEPGTVPDHVEGTTIVACTSSSKHQKKHSLHMSAPFRGLFIDAGAVSHREQRRRGIVAPTQTGR